LFPLFATGVVDTLMLTLCAATISNIHVL
jgi:hypothetical protein